MDYSKDELLKLLGLTIVVKDEVNTYSLGEAIDKITDDSILVWEYSLRKGSELFYLYCDESSQVLTDNTGEVLIYPLDFINEKFFILDTEKGLFL